MVTTTTTVGTVAVVPITTETTVGILVAAMMAPTINQVVDGVKGAGEVLVQVVLFLVKEMKSSIGILLLSQRYNLVPLPNIPRIQMAHTVELLGATMVPGTTGVIVVVTTGTVEMEV